MKKEFIIGIDEAGRGPLAGPVAVGVVALPVDFDFPKNLPVLRDSKKMTEKARLEWHKFVLVNDMIFSAVVMTQAEEIDKRGIVKAITRAVEKGLNKIWYVLLKKGVEGQIVLDAGIKVGKDYFKGWPVKQEKRADDNFAAVSLAAIMAKVERDRVMVKLDKKFPDYGFSSNKGYGTREHLRVLSLKGLSAAHRASYKVKRGSNL